MFHAMHSCLLSIALLASPPNGSPDGPAPLSERSPGLIVAGGKACAAIVTPEKSNAAEQYAAADLQDVLRKMTGATLPIVADEQEAEGNRILVGDTRFTDAVVSRDERDKAGEEGCVVAELKDNLAEAQRLAKDPVVKRRLEKMAILTHYTDRLSSAFRLANQSSKEKDKKQSLRLLQEAYSIGEALRDDLLTRPDYYQGVATGVYYRNNLYMDRLLASWRKRLVSERMLKEE